LESQEHKDPVPVDMGRLSLKFLLLIQMLFVGTAARNILVFHQDLV